MPTAMLKPCSYPGCTNLVRSGRCSAHPYPDQHNHESQKLYNSKRWLGIRARQLKKQPWCEECLRANIYTAATDVDHIEPHRGDVTRFYKGPFQSLCKSCHSKKTAGEVLGGGA